MKASKKKSVGIYLAATTAFLADLTPAARPSPTIASPKITPRIGLGITISAKLMVPSAINAGVIPTSPAATSTPRAQAINRVLNVQAKTIVGA